MNCYVCDTELSKENETEEHILLNAIGGRLKSKKLICKDCNSTFGSNIDDKLAEQLNPIANLLDVKRDRGKPPNIKGKSENKEILIEPGGKMKLARAYYDKVDNQINIEAPNIKAVTNLLKGLKRNYPNINIDELLEKGEKRKEFLSAVSINLGFGGQETNRAICKMAINYYILNNGDTANIKHLLSYVNGQENEAEVYYFYPRSEVFYKGEKDVFHSLILVGDPNREHLYVYVELFNEFKFIVFISRNYEGREIRESYHYNVITNEVVEFENTIHILPRDIKKYASKEIEIQKFEERMKLLFQRIDKVTMNRRISDITQSAIDEMVKKFPPEKYPYITEEMIRFLVDKVAKDFILSFQNRLFSEIK